MYLDKTLFEIGILKTKNDLAHYWQQVKKHHEHKEPPTIEQWTDTVDEVYIPGKLLFSIKMQKQRFYQVLKE